MSKFSVRLADAADLQRWDSFVDRSPMGSAFHRLGWLRAAEKESESVLLPIICEKSGEGTICQLPLFSLRKGAFKVLLSPPPGCAIPYLGPVFCHSSDKQYRIEADVIGVVDNLVVFLRENLPHHYLRIVGSPELHDVRPFQWSGFSVAPGYTYRLALNRDPEAIFQSFDQRVRQRAKQAQTQRSWVVRKSQADDYFEVIQNVRRRYREQSRRFAPSDRYFQALADGLNNHILGAVALVSEEDWVSGIIVVRHKDNVKVWLGGMKPQKSFVGANELLHWQIVTETLAEGNSYYERVGTNTPRLCRNKSKYGLRPVPYFVLERGSIGGRIAATLYKQLRSGRRDEGEDDE